MSWMNVIDVGLSRRRPRRPLNICSCRQVWASHWGSGHRVTGVIPTSSDRCKGAATVCISSLLHKMSNQPNHKEESRYSYKQSQGML